MDNTVKTVSGIIALVIIASCLGIAQSDVTVTLGLGNVSANTIVTNSTGSAAPPTAIAAPSGGTAGCSGTTDAVTYTSSGGASAWGCHQISGGTGITGLTANSIPKAANSTSIEDSLLSDNSTTLTYTGTGGISSSGPITAGSGGGTGVEILEGTCTTPTGTSSGICADSSFHGLKYSYHGSSTFNFGMLSSSTTTTDGQIPFSTTTAGIYTPRVLASTDLPALGDATATTLLATGIVDGKAPVTLTTGTSATLGGTYLSGYTFNQQTGAAGNEVTYTLPTASAGKQYCIANDNGGAVNTGILRLNTSASGQHIRYKGTIGASGGYIRSGGAAGDAGCAVGISSTDWIFYVNLGTWTQDSGG